MCAVARIDDRAIDFLGQKMHRACLGVAHHNDVRAHRVQGHSRVDERLALGGAIDKAATEAKRATLRAARAPLDAFLLGPEREAPADPRAFYEFSLAQGLTSAVLFSSTDDIYFSGNPRYFADAFEQGGGTVLRDFSFSLADEDFSTQVNDLGNLSPAPDVLYTAMISPQLGPLLGQIHGAGIDIALIGAENIAIAARRPGTVALWTGGALAVMAALRIAIQSQFYFFFVPISASNVLVYCATCRDGVRQGRRFSPSGQKERYCKKCGGSLGALGRPKAAHASR